MLLPNIYLLYMDNIPGFPPHYDLLLDVNELSKFDQTCIDMFSNMPIIIYPTTKPVDNLEQTNELIEKLLHEENVTNKLIYIV